MGPEATQPAESPDPVFESLKRIAGQVLAVEPEDITEDSLFDEDLGADSLDLVELAMAVEDNLDVTLDEDELEGVTSVGQILGLVRLKLVPEEG